MGSANITVTSYNGKSNTVTMKFFDPPTSLTLSERQATLQVGETLKLTVDCNCGGTWESSDDAVATVSNTGLITALKKGSATITATTYNGISADCKVTVTAPQEEQGTYRKYSYTTSLNYEDLSIPSDAKVMTSSPGFVTALAA